jgi:hypothetical protein
MNDKPYLFSSHLYAQFLAVDTNFWLKLRDWGQQSTEILAPGWAYFVEPDAFANEIRRVGSSKQISEVNASHLIPST